MNTYKELFDRNKTMPRAAAPYDTYPAIHFTHVQLKLQREAQL